MKAIETSYRKTRFRSRLEAQVAEFFDHIGIAWLYEPAGYTNGTIHYLPDFWLPGVYSRGRAGGVFFEVKPASPSPGESHKAVMLATGLRRPVLVMTRQPCYPTWESLDEFVRDGVRDWDDSGLHFARCDTCGTCDVGIYASDEPACPCGAGTFNPYNGCLNAGRNSFAQFGRWSRAA